MCVKPPASVRMGISGFKFSVAASASVAEEDVDWLWEVEESSLSLLAVGDEVSGDGGVSGGEGDSGISTDVSDDEAMHK